MKKNNTEVELHLEVLAKLLSNVNNYIKKNFPNKPALFDIKMLSEENAEVYGFHGLTVMVKENADYVRYYPLIPSHTK